jgi:hypothetical protein
VGGAWNKWQTTGEPFQRLRISGDKPLKEFFAPERSKNLLLHPNRRTSEIAFEVGFQSLSYFSRVFKKTLSQSPTEYRAQLQRN